MKLARNKRKEVGRVKASIMRSRKNKKNKVTIILEMGSRESTELLEKEIKKAVHHWNRLLSKKMSFKILIIKPDSHNFQEVQQNQFDR